jgi:hypothetical protein
MPVDQVPADGHNHETDERADEAGPLLLLHGCNMPSAGAAPLALPPREVYDCGLLMVGP